MGIPFEKSFASHPKSIYWNCEKNNGIKPIDVFKSSNKKYWFNCDNCLHNFEGILGDINTGGWCSYCTNKKLCDVNTCKECFEKSFASYPKSIYWNYDKNEKIKPRDVFKSSHTNYYFDCNKCNHTFNTSLSNINKGVWCNYCAKRKLCNNEDCRECFDKSFSSHLKSIYWNYEKNNGLKPRNVFKSSDKKYWFNCDKCNHTFNTSLLNISLGGGWCIYCAKPSKKLCDNENCCECFNRSFASNQKSIYWNNEKNENIKPRDVFKSINKKFWFNCDKCSHTFNSGLDKINGGGWCSYCTKKKLCDDDTCKDCFNRSFAFNSRSIYWDNEKNENIKPRDVFKCSGNKYWFSCDKNHSFKTSIASIKNNKWCPICINKTEQKILENLQSKYPTLIHQYKQEWCKNINCLPFDFCIPEHNIIIELDGLQHFQQVRNWKTPEEHLERDLYKEKKAKENGYCIIRLLQQNVYDDTYDWFNELLENIQKIINEKPKIQNIYMCKNSEYSNYL